jgi:hypothetical protein
MSAKVSRRAVIGSLAGAALAPALAPALPLGKQLWTGPAMRGMSEFVVPVTGTYEIVCRFVREGMPDQVLVETHSMMAGEIVEPVMDHEEGIAFVQSAVKLGGA